MSGSSLLIADFADDIKGPYIFVSILGAAILILLVNDWLKKRKERRKVHTQTSEVSFAPAEFGKDSPQLVEVFNPDHLPLVKFQGQLSREDCKRAIDLFVLPTKANVFCFSVMLVVFWCVALGHLHFFGIAVAGFLTLIAAAYLSAFRSCQKNSHLNDPHLGAFQTGRFDQHGYFSESKERSVTYKWDELVAYGISEPYLMIGATNKPIIILRNDLIEHSHERTLLYKAFKEKLTKSQPLLRNFWFGGFCLYLAGVFLVAAVS